MAAASPGASWRASRSSTAILCTAEWDTKGRGGGGGHGRGLLNTLLIYSVNMWCNQSVQSIRVFQCYRTRHLFLHCTVPCASTHTHTHAHTRTQSTTSSLPSDTVTPLSHFIRAAVKRLRENSACINNTGNWHSDHCVDTGYSIMTNLKLHNLATPDQAVVLFTAFCFVFLLWKRFFLSFHYGSIFNSTAKCIY